MRLPVILATALTAAAIATGAQAAPTINIEIGAELADKTDVVSDRDLEFLKSDLRESIERQIARGALADADGVLTVVIEDATPNRPTMTQLTRTPGLSYESRGIGGATLSGTLVSADGSSRSISFRWYESDIRNTIAAGTWSDAETSFDRFARKLARGDMMAAN